MTELNRPTPPEDVVTTNRVFLNVPDGQGGTVCRWVSVDEMSEEVYSGLKQLGVPLADRKTVEERLPRGVVTAAQIRDELLRGRVSPELAAASIQRIFEREGLDPEEAYLRVISQHQVFSDANQQLPQAQGERWDRFVVSIGQSLGIPEEQRLRGRLAPDEFEDLDVIWPDDPRYPRPQLDDEIPW